ncbi:MAG: indolepyruvate ferredoxin oxidoreductase subunit alpha [Tissierellia bacterium]|nr:indolepyruvate ferredoxin oxidoreductase subunit alpha [Tissierellia bacterium]
MKELMSGNEAIARGAYEAGVHFAAAYPGTPSTEIIENCAQYKEIRSEWATNEKVAMETAIGASIAGGRALSAMKMVGVNVAADPLFTYAYMGVNGGFVFVSADDPSMFSSQNEQDNRNFAPFARIAMLEPSDPQECLDMTKAGFEISEEYNTTVMIRTTTRVNHGQSLVELGERKEVPLKHYDRAMGQTRFDAVPALSKKLRVQLEDRLEKLREYSEKSDFNFEIDNGSKTGVISSGVAYTYAREVFGKTVNYLKLGITYPLPAKKIQAFADKVDKLYVIEELDPYIENELKKLGIKCIGKDILPAIGELSTAIIKEKILGEVEEEIDIPKDKLVPRPPTLCAGCPHRGFFYELGKVKNIMITSDIGCYGLGGAAPLNAKDTCICMGGGVGTGHGAQYIMDKKGEGGRAFSIMGDSTFFHTGINGVINAAYNKSTEVICILDNRITAMTGHQDNPGTGFTAGGEATEEIDIETLVRAFGIDRVRTINPHKLDEVKDALKWAGEKNELTVLITRYPCALKKYSEEDIGEFGPLKNKFYVNTDTCIGCKKCTKTGCPAIHFRTTEKKSSINPDMCVGCSVCSQVCPVKAILPLEK